MARLKSFFMQDGQDKRLDIPAESNREKHINFMDAEEKAGAGSMADDNCFGSAREDEERRKQWQQGLQEGREAASQNND